jgi:hypothetical protein
MHSVYSLLPAHLIILNIVYHCLSFSLFTMLGKATNYINNIMVMVYRCNPSHVGCFVWNSVFTCASLFEL